MTTEEWAFIVEANTHVPCVTCFRTLLAAPDHGGDEVRLQRLLDAYAVFPTVDGVGHRRFGRYERTADGRPDTSVYLPRGDPRFVLEIEARLPATMQRWYHDAFLADLYASAKRGADPALQTRVAERYVTALGVRPEAKRVHHYCTHMSARLEELYADAVPGLDRLREVVCWCAAGKLKEVKLDHHLRATWAKIGKACR